MKKRPRLSLDLLRGFRAAARHLSFTRAAQELFVTQSAISREIKTLEDQLGQPLFHRVNRVLQLTHAGEELYRIADETLAELDAVVDRLAGFGKTLAVTTTSGFASLWLAPRLPRFNRSHPGIDVRIVASNDRPDLERDQLDLAIRFVAPGSDIPASEELLDCKSFPVCSPALARGGAHPIRTPADLAHHVRLDYDTVRDGRRLSEWDFWFEAMKIRPVAPASTLQFPQYDQVASAAIEGSGVAMGVLPHVAQYLREGVLCAPFGREGIAQRGKFFIVRRPDVAGRDAVRAFVTWLWSEAKREGEAPLDSPQPYGGTRVPRVRASNARAKTRRS
ncbi:MAG TPA: LysR substrate-binding domain-containing protein [Burkholderiales bacterium]|nr:LysR substrate-binding domain-containing protein [Burkholderiales bacterium]